MTIPEPQRTPDQHERVCRVEERRAQVLDVLNNRIAFYTNHPPKRMRSPAFRLADSDAVIECVRTVDAIDWLVEHPSEREQLEWLAEQVGDACAEVLQRPEARNPAWHHRLADHFWCDGVAALVQVLELAQKAVGNLIDAVAQLGAQALTNQVVDKVAESRANSRGNRPRPLHPKKAATRESLDRQAQLPEALLQHAIGGLLTQVVNALQLGGQLTFTHLLLKLRVFACLLCPDASAHRAVWDHCLLPLLQGAITSEVRDTLLKLRNELHEPLSWHA